MVWWPCWNVHCLIGSAGHVAGAAHGLNCPNDINLSDSGDALLIANWSGHNIVSVPWPDRLEEPAGARYNPVSLPSHPALWRWLHDLVFCHAFQDDSQGRGRCPAKPTVCVQSIVGEGGY